VWGGQNVTVFGHRLLREERVSCDGVWEQLAGERRRQNVRVFGTSLLLRGEGRK